MAFFSSLFNLEVHSRLELEDLVQWYGIMFASKIYNSSRHVLNVTNAAKSVVGLPTSELFSSYVFEDEFMVIE